MGYRHVIERRMSSKLPVKVTRKEFGNATVINIINIMLMKRSMEYDADSLEARLT